jgi:hypothetical protein
MVKTRNKAYNRKPEGRVTKTTDEGKSLTADVLTEQDAPEFLAGRVTDATGKAKSLTANKRKKKRHGWARRWKWGGSDDGKT